MLALLAVYFISILIIVGSSGPFSIAAEWAPALNLSLSFRFDGLSALFATLITVVGTVIVVYATKYFEHHQDAGKFNAALFAFMGSMLGLVLSDNVIALFVFWELTGFTSYLLIGFEHDRPEARRAATQALLVTGGGGLALLAAGILMLQAGGTAQLSELAGKGSLVANPAYPAIVALVLLAAFTKSAQFPFHFWLPNAMQAPTPVSAYLHSATMVKAGVYLVARMTPIVGGTMLWSSTIVIIGAVDDASGRRTRDAGDRSQACPGLLHDQRAGHPDVVVCDWDTGGSHGWAGVSGRTRLLQGRTIPRCWCCRTRNRNERRHWVGRLAARHACDRAGRWHRRCIDGGRPVLRWLHREGAAVRHRQACCASR